MKGSKILIVVVKEKNCDRKRRSEGNSPPHTLPHSNTIPNT